MTTYDLTLHNGFTNLTPDAARQVLAAAAFRLVEKSWTFEGNTEIYNGIEIFHDGAWKTLCRTDDYDNVMTSWGTTLTLARWVEHYTSGIRLGARYDAKTFAVIDSVTDG